MNNNSLKIFDSNVNNLLDEIEDIVVPLSFEIFEVKKRIYLTIGEYLKNLRK